MARVKPTELQCHPAVIWAGCGHGLKPVHRGHEDGGGRNAETRREVGRTGRDRGRKISPCHRPQPWAVGGQLCSTAKAHRPLKAAVGGTGMGAVGATCPVRRSSCSEPRKVRYAVTAQPPLPDPPFDPPSAVAANTPAEQQPLMIDTGEAATSTSTLPNGFRCPECGYDLSNAPVPRCSECGRNIAPLDLALFAEQPMLHRNVERVSRKRIYQTVSLLWITVPFLCLGPWAFLLVFVPLATLLATPLLACEILGLLVEARHRHRFRAHFYERLWSWHRPWMTAILCVIPMPVFFHWADVYQVSNDAPITGCISLMAIWTIVNVLWASRNLSDPEWRRVLSPLSRGRRLLIHVALVGLYAMSMPVLGLLVTLVTRLFD